MADPSYQLLDIVGTSSLSSDDAIRQALRAVASGGRRVDWFEVTETRGQAQDGEVRQFQVTLKVGIRLDERPTDRIKT